MSDRPDVLERKGLKLVLFEEIVQILLQHLEDQTGVVLVSETLVGSDKVVFVCIFLAEMSPIRTVSDLTSSRVDFISRRLKENISTKLEQ